MKTKHVFLTGLPFVGKTTALLRTMQSLDLAYGCITQGIEIEGKRIGLNIITTDHHEFKVASSNAAATQRIGKYAVDIAALDRAMQDVLNKSRLTKYIYIDEVGTLFCQSVFFISAVRTLLESHVVMGVISRKGHPFIEEIHHRPDCCFMEVTADNRDGIPGMILKNIKSS